MKKHLISFASMVALFLALPAQAQAQHWSNDTNWCTHNGAKLYLADLNGDGRTDLLCHDPNRLWINYADTSGKFTGKTDWSLDTNWCTHKGSTLYVADFNGDGRADLLCRDPNRLWIDYADKSGKFTGKPDWFLDTNWCTHKGSTLYIADFNGDKRADLLCRDPGRLWINYANTSGQFAK
jgi:hypothetical protein